MSASHPVEMDSLFGDYPLDGAYDEMREPNGELRPHYRALAETLARLPEEELQRRKQSADLSFLTQGITFTVYGRDEGTERIFPYDLLPRLITAQEWDLIERGLTQRITALNHFLRDVYSDAKILNDKVIPRELAACRSRAMSTSPSSAPTCCASTPASSSCLKITFAYPPASAICSLTAA
jgi:uncharacterized circularly permuted ATP-grasp superfamily protein